MRLTLAWYPSQYHLEINTTTAGELWVATIGWSEKTPEGWAGFKETAPSPASAVARLLIRLATHVIEADGGRIEPNR